MFLLSLSEHYSNNKQERSAECEAFQHVYAHIFSHISDCDPHLTIVNYLYSASLLDKTTRDTLTDPRKQRVNQIRCLLAQLEGMIETKPEVYQQLIVLLEQQEACWFNQLGQTLKESYGMWQGYLIKT